MLRCRYDKTFLRKRTMYLPSRELRVSSKALSSEPHQNQILSKTMEDAERHASSFCVHSVHSVQKIVKLSLVT